MKRLLLAFLLLAGPIQAAELHVVSSGGFAAAYKVLAPGFEAATGHTLVTGWGPSMGNTPEAVPARLARNEPIDVVIMVGYALGKLEQDGRILPNSRQDLARSGIVMAVQAGAPVPDISTLDGLRAAMLAAKSIAYSDSASGVYIEREMLKTLGIADAVKDRARMIPAEPVGNVVARGDAEIGFQQMSELKPVKGITLVGLLPPGAQQYTVFSAGVLANSAHAEAARALVAYLGSAQAAATIRDSGMEPLTE